MEYNGVTYYYGKNAQGDIVKIYNASGTEVVSYTYDAWGKVLSVTDANGNAITSSTHIGNINPFRYRSYYYDTETGFYYLQSRYYDPEVGRFLNADSIVNANGGIYGYNLFAYCNNNPVMYDDPSGEGFGLFFRKVEDGDGDPYDEMLASINGGTPIGGSAAYTIEGIYSYSNYLSATNFLRCNRAYDVEKVLSSYQGIPKVQTLEADTTVYRTWGGKASELGHWVSPYDYGTSARSMLSLPPTNTMAYTSTFILSRGTTVLAGIAGPLFCQPGGGVQWWVPVL